MTTHEDSKTLKILLNDASRFPDANQWRDLNAFKEGMGARPEGAALLKRNTRTAHAPGNSYWSTNKGQREADKLLRKANKPQQVQSPHPQTKKALKAALQALKAPTQPQPPTRRRTQQETQQENEQQAALLLAALRGPNYEPY